MIRRVAMVAVSGLLLAGCGTSQMETPGYFPTASPIDGRWVSTDGAFVVNFHHGNFKTERVRTSGILARGTYSMVDDKIRMVWVSIKTGERLSATCSMPRPDAARCLQAGIGGFNLRRIA
jgi:hypothetical protein